MARMRASYGEMPTRRADAMQGAMSEPMMMERMMRKNFDVPQPVMMAENEPPVLPQAPNTGAEAYPTRTMPITTVPPAGSDASPYVDPGATGSAAGAAIKYHQDELKRALEEIKKQGM